MCIKGSSHKRLYAEAKYKRDQWQALHEKGQAEQAEKEQAELKRVQDSKIHDQDLWRTPDQFEKYYNTQLLSKMRVKKASDYDENMKVDEQWENKLRKYKTKKSKAKLWDWPLVEWRLISDYQEKW